jgi:TRAP-type transport system periplasmic protein
MQENIMMEFRLLVITACMVFPLAAMVQAETITLSFSQQNADNSWSGLNAIAPWSKKVEAAARGEVKIKNYWNQSLSKGKDNWMAVKHGIVDMAWCFHGDWPGLTPLSDVISLPGLPFMTAEEGSAALWKLYEKFPEIQKEYQMPKALGAIPTLIPMPEMFLSLQRGVVDGMGAPWEAIYGFRLYETVKYYTETPFPAGYFSIIMNQKKWDRLPKDVQEGIMSVTGTRPLAGDSRKTHLG